MNLIINDFHYEEAGTLVCDIFVEFERSTLEHKRSTVFATNLGHWLRAVGGTITTTLDTDPDAPVLQHDRHTMEFPIAGGDADKLVDEIGKGLHERFQKAEEHILPGKTNADIMQRVTNLATGSVE